MTHKFGGSSKERLDTVDRVLQEVMEYAISISHIDFGIPRLGGKRTAEEQCKLFRQNLSKCDGVNKVSKHQSGLAIDVVAYVNGGYTYEKEYYYMIYQAVMIAAKVCKVSIRWGGDWDGDLNLRDQSFNDLCHFEVIL